LEPLVFFSVDFFEFQTAVSQVLGNFYPVHNFQMQYKVEMNAHTLQYMELEGFDIDLIQQCGNNCQVEINTKGALIFDFF
jgi:hypothetical protein